MAFKIPNAYLLCANRKPTSSLERGLNTLFATLSAYILVPTGQGLVIHHVVSDTEKRLNKPEPHSLPRYLIGLGLGDAKDITVNGLEAVRSSDYVYLEHYTAILGVDTEALEKFYGKTVILADREMVESDADTIVARAKEETVSMLVVGDPFWSVNISGNVQNGDCGGV